MRQSMFGIAHGIYAGRSAANRGWRRGAGGQRFFVLDPDLIGRGGHHYGYARLLQTELGAGNVRFYGHAAPHLSVAATFDTRPVFRDSIYHRPANTTFEQTFRRKSDAWVQACAAIEPEDLHPETIAIVHTATVFVLGGLAAWYTSLPAHRRPRLFVQFQHPLEFSFDAETEGERAVRAARDAARALTAAGMVRFAANTTGCAALIACQLEAPCELVPCPIGWPDRDDGPGVIPDKTFGFFGALRDEKGAALLPAAIEAFAGRHPDARFIVQAAPGQCNPAVVRRLEGIAQVDLIRSAFDGGESYFAALRRARWILLPYDPQPYRIRTSGIFIEAAGLGIPLIVTPGTWMADELQALGAAGFVMRDYSVDALVSSLDEAWLAMSGVPATPHTPNPAVMMQYGSAAFCGAIRRLMHAGPARAAAREMTVSIA